VLAIWHALVHVLGLDYTGRYGHIVPYDFYSGLAGSFLVGLAAYLALFWWHQTCHYSWRCLRRGKHEAAGGVFRLCWKHHPDMGEKPHRAMIHRLHREWQAGR